MRIKSQFWAQAHASFKEDKVELEKLEITVEPSFFINLFTELSVNVKEFCD